MRHKLTMPHPAGGKTFEVILETAGVKWQAIWRTVNAEGVPVRGPHGSTVDANGVELVERVKAMLVAEDPAVAGAEFSYEKPYPPWKDASE